MSKVIHKPHPNGQAHPFKYATLCGILSRFGSVETGEREVTCKKCLKIFETICPSCGGSGTKEKNE